MKYTVRFERDESGAWITTVPKVRGCHTYGRSIDEARKRVREALSLFVADAAKAELVDDVRLPASALALMRRVKQTRARARTEQARANRTASSAARALCKQLGLSVRDSGQLLGLSHQRVHQLLEESK